MNKNAEAIKTSVRSLKAVKDVQVYDNDLIPGPFRVPRGAIAPGYVFIVIWRTWWSRFLAARGFKKHQPNYIVEQVQRQARLWSAAGVQVAVLMADEIRWLDIR